MRMRGALVGLVSVLATVGVVAACGGGDDSADDSPADPPVAASTQPQGGNPQPEDGATVDERFAPRTADAAAALVREVIRRVSVGDGGGAWDLLERRGQEAIDRDEYARYVDTCRRTRENVLLIQVRDARLENPDLAAVNAEAVGTRQTFLVPYQDGMWRMPVPDEDLAAAADGADGLIDSASQNGAC